MSRPGEKFRNNLQVVVGLDLVGGEDTVLASGLEHCDRDHQVAGEVVGVGLCEGEIVRHFGGSILERANSR